MKKLDSQKQNPLIVSRGLSIMCRCPLKIMSDIFDD